MRLFTLAFLCAFQIGCARTEQPLAGGKSVASWVEALGDPDPKVRKQAVLKLGNAGPTDPSVLPALLGALKDREANIRCAAVLALLKCGPEGKEGIPALMELSQNDSDAKVRSHAVKALEKLQQSE